MRIPMPSPNSKNEPGAKQGKAITLNRRTDDKPLRTEPSSITPCAPPSPTCKEGKAPSPNSSLTRSDQKLDKQTKQKQEPSLTPSQQSGVIAKTDFSGRAHRKIDFSRQTNPWTSGAQQPSPSSPSSSSTRRKERRHHRPPTMRNLRVRSLKEEAQTSPKVFPYL